jgi:hypothetical protein
MAGVGVGKLEVVSSRKVHITDPPVWHWRNPLSSLLRRSLRTF